MRNEIREDLFEIANEFRKHCSKRIPHSPSPVEHSQFGVSVPTHFVCLTKTVRTRVSVVFSVYLFEQKKFHGGSVGFFGRRAVNVRSGHFGEKEFVFQFLVSDSNRKQIIDVFDALFYYRSRLGLVILSRQHDWVGNNVFERHIVPRQNHHSFRIFDDRSARQTDVFSGFVQSPTQPAFPFGHVDHFGKFLKERKQTDAIFGLFVDQRDFVETFVTKAHRVVDECHVATFAIVFRKQGSHLVSVFKYMRLCVTCVSMVSLNCSTVVT